MNATIRGTLAACLMLATCVASVSHAQSDPAFLDRAAAEKATGEQIFTHICQDCHMAQGQGAKGAGTYPALARNPKLASPQYPAALVLYGRGAMPGFGTIFSDAQVADVVNYVRTHFGNHYNDTISAADVKAMRH